MSSKLEQPSYVKSVEGAYSRASPAGVWAGFDATPPQVDTAQTLAPKVERGSPHKQVVQLFYSYWFTHVYLSLVCGLFISYYY